MTQELALTEHNRPGALVELVAEPARILAAWKQFEQLKKDLLTDSDFQVYTEKVKEGKQWVERDKRFVKKSGWRKIASAFGISLETINSKVEELANGHLSVLYTVRATAPGSARYSDGVGGCDSMESRFQKKVWENGKVVGSEIDYKINDLHATAYTRAANRAISDLVGGGEVSAEEVTSEAPQVIEQPKLLGDGGQKKLLEIARTTPGGMETLAAFAVKHLPLEASKEIAAQLKDIKPQVVEILTQDGLTQKQFETIEYYKGKLATAKTQKEREGLMISADSELGQELVNEYLKDGESW